MNGDPAISTRQRVLVITFPNRTAAAQWDTMTTEQALAALVTADCRRRPSAPVVRRNARHTTDPTGTDRKARR